MENTTPSRLAQIEAEVMSISWLRAEIFRRGEHATNVAHAAPADATVSVKFRLPG